MLIWDSENIFLWNCYRKKGGKNWEKNYVKNNDKRKTKVFYSQPNQRLRACSATCLKFEQFRA